MATRPSTSRRRRKPPISHMMLITAAQGNLTQTCPATRGEPRAPLPGAADGVLDGGRGRRPTQPADAYTAIIASSEWAAGLRSADAPRRGLPPLARSAPAASRLRARARGARQRVRERSCAPVPAHLPPQRARDLVRARRQRSGGPVGGSARQRLPRRHALGPGRAQAGAARLARGDDGRLRADAADPDGVARLRDLHALGHRQRVILAVPVGPPRWADPGGAARACLRAAGTLDERRRRARWP